VAGCAVERGEVEAALHARSRSCPRNRRIVVVLRDLEGLSYEEIADVLDLELGTAARACTGRADLKEQAGALSAMSCHDARESLSAFLDEALAPDERQRVAQHLEGCRSAGASWRGSRQTVALLHRVEPVRAPVGFVDAVTAAARPPAVVPARGRRRLPPLLGEAAAEATAVVMVALLAVYVFERTPALQESGPDPARSPRGFPREDRRPAPRRC